jgi:hypothetical protein
MVDWLNPAYTAETLHDAAKNFARSGNIQLLQFLSQKGLDRFKLKFKRKYDPLKYSFGMAKAPEFVKSMEFCAVLSAVIGREMHVLQAGSLQFEKGDYTVLCDTVKPGKGVFFILDLLDGDESWGGYMSFMKGDREVVRVVPKGNALSLVDIAGLKNFVKYLNHHAQKPRVFLYGVLTK